MFTQGFRGTGGSGGGPTHPTLFLLNATEATIPQDSSLYVRDTQNLNNSFVKDSTYPINGQPTYRYVRSGIPGQSANLGSYGDWLQNELENNFTEFCLESVVYIDSLPPYNINGPLLIAKDFFVYWRRGELGNPQPNDGKINFRGQASIPPLDELDLWSTATYNLIGQTIHTAIILDRTTSASNTLIHCFINGVLEATVTFSITWTPLFQNPAVGAAIASSGLGGLFSSTGVDIPNMALGSFRITKNRRYLTNTVGQPVNNFTPDAHPMSI